MVHAINVAGPLRCCRYHGQSNGVFWKIQKRASPYVTHGRLICAWFSRSRTGVRRSRTTRGCCERGRLDFEDGMESRFSRRIDADGCRGSAAFSHQPVSRTSSGESPRDWSGAGATGSRVAAGSRGAGERRGGQPLADGSQFQSVQGALARQRLLPIPATPILSRGIRLSHQHRQQGGMSQIVVILEFLIPQTRPVHALPKQFRAASHS